MKPQLHIVSFNVPWPADYGGVIDVYNRLRALREAGVGMVLHCFEYGRQPAPELDSLCAEVHYYHRSRSPLLQLRPTPFIVASRPASALKARLGQDRLPVLLEGLHCSSLLLDSDLCRGRRTLLRAHNVEADYYRRLARSERPSPHRAYLALEASKLRRYEPPTLRRADTILAISAADRDAIAALGCPDVRLMPAALPCPDVTAQPGSGSYALFHGNLEVAENHTVALELVRALGGSGVPLVVAGHNPPPHLRREAARHANVTLTADPSDAQMSRLIADAHVCLMFTHQPTGLKLKLLRSLAEGRHIVANPDMLHGTGLDALCTVVGHPGEAAAAVRALLPRPFTAAALARRRDALAPFAPSNAILPLLSLL